jgi:hypothetical protein
VGHVLIYGHAKQNPSLAEGIEEFVDGDLNGACLAEERDAETGHRDTVDREWAFVFVVGKAPLP